MDMKRPTYLNLTVITVALGLAGGAVHAQIIAYEPFASGGDPSAGAYGDGVPLNNANPTNPPFTGAWNNPTSRLQTTAAGLSYTLADGTVFGSLDTGSVIRRSDTGGTGVQVHSRLADQGTSINTPTDLWVGFLIRPGSTASGEVLLAGFHLGGAAHGRAFAGFSGGDLVAGFTNGTSPGLTSIGSAVAGETYLFVGHLEVIQTGNHTDGPEYFTWYVNPTDLSSPAALEATSLYTYDFTGNLIFQEYGFGGLYLRASGVLGSGNMVDEAMVGFTLADILSLGTPAPAEPVIPEPGSALLALTGVAAILLRRRRRPRR